MYTLPSYIEKSGIIGVPIVAKPLDNSLYAKHSDRKLISRLNRLTFRAMVSLGVAVTEWTFWRLHTPEEFLPPYQYIEAAWAANIDYSYIKEWNCYFNIEFPKVPGYGGMLEALNKLSHSIADLKKCIPSSNWIGYTVVLCRYVMPDDKVKAFNNWLEVVVERLETFYPLVDFRDDYEGEEWTKHWPIWKGTPVPREFFNPDFDYKPEMADELIQKFLSGLNHETNPYLSKPEDMIANGFTGTPYK